MTYFGSKLSSFISIGTLKLIVIILIKRLREFVSFILCCDVLCVAFIHGVQH